MPPLKIFADTNIWFSAVYGSSHCQKLVAAHLDHKINLVVSQQVLKELIKNLQKKIPEALPTLEEIFLSRLPEIVSDPEKINSRIKRLINKKDQAIFVSALQAKVKYFVTGNIKDFKVKELEKLTDIKIITPQEAVRLLNL